jgi:hypothetical protein
MYVCMYVCTFVCMYVCMYVHLTLVFRCIAEASRDACGGWRAKTEHAKQQPQLGFRFTGASYACAGLKFLAITPPSYGTETRT